MSCVVLFASTGSLCCYGQGVALGLSTGTADPGSSVTLNLSLSETSGDSRSERSDGKHRPSSVQWTLEYSTADFSSASFAVGPVATAANKTLSCNTIAGLTTCIVWGNDSTPISNGIVASVSLQLSASTKNTSSQLELANGIAVDGTGVFLWTTADGNSVTILQPPGLNGLSCSPLSITPPATSTCVLRLTAPALSGGATISLSASPAIVTIPSTITIPSGASSATFTLYGGVVSIPTQVTLFASYSGVTEDLGLTINPPQNSQPAISYVQGNYATPQAPQTTVNVTFSSAQSAGDLNVVVVGWNDSSTTVSAVTDTSGNVYTPAVGPTVQAGAASQSIYYAKNIASAAAGTNQVTVAFAGAANSADIRILEYSGADPNNPVDVTAANSGNSATTSSGAATTTNATDLLFAANLVQTLTTGSGANFTSRMLTSPDGDIAEDWMVTAAGTYTATAPLNSAGPWIMQMVAFRSVNTTPPTTPGNLTAQVSGSQINLSWTASSDNVGVTGYLLKRCQGPGCANFAQIATPTGTSYSDTGLTASTSYSYRVRATDAAGNLSPYSNVASGVILDTYKVLHVFRGKDGANPEAGLIIDSAGNLYGTTKFGGDNNGGTVFKLSPTSNSSWTQSVLYSFCSVPNCTDGHYPFAALISDAAGNLYGTTDWIGDNDYGTVFKLTPNRNGSWTESVLYSFCSLPNCADGFDVRSSLTFDAAGNLYGTSYQGGDFGDGTVFKLTPNSNGGWTESVPYSFCSLKFCADGANPSAGLIFDVAGNLYGTTTFGGGSRASLGLGVVFKLAPQPDGSWTESLISAFHGPNGMVPEASLVSDKAGSFYGTTLSGGSTACGGPGCGVVFKLTPNSDGTRSESVLHRFLNAPAANPWAPLITDAAGNLYGTASSSAGDGYGAVFKLTPELGGGWAYSVLHVFLGAPGGHPFGGLVLDRAGNLYGTAYDCASNTGCYGLVFEITP